MGIFKAYRLGLQCRILEEKLEAIPAVSSANAPEDKPVNKIDYAAVRDRILEKLDLTLSDTEGNPKSDRYGRTVDEVFSSKNGVEKNFNEEQLSSGNAYVYPQYVGKCPNKLAFEKAEAIAQSTKLGVWSGNYQKPWDYRREQRQK